MPLVLMSALIGLSLLSATFGQGYPSAPVDSPAPQDTSGGVSGFGPVSAGAQVAIVDNGFAPGGLTVRVGDSVTWSNTGKRTHTTTGDTGAWSSGSLASGGTFTFTFATPGTYAYHCSIHAEMHGTIVVQANSSATPTATPGPATAPPPAQPTATQAPSAAAPAPTAAPSPTAPPSPPTAQSADGKISATFATPTAGSISPVSDPGTPAPDGDQLGHTIFVLSSNPASAATLNVQPDEDELADVGGVPSRLVLAQLDPASGSWQVLDTSVNTDGTLSATAPGPGTFAVLEVS